jgi:glyoxylase-like metal-dependent hydrolase (beta-lactamase superfamily II)
VNTADLDLTPRQLLPNLFYIKHSDPGALRMGMSTNTYVLASNERALLIDPLFDYLLQPINEILSKGFSLSGILFTHRHLVSNGNFLYGLTNKYNVPLFLHSADQRYLKIRGLNYAFENPVEHPLTKEFDIEVIHFPGHTEGSIIIYQKQNGGLLMTGDAAVGPSEKQIQNGQVQLVRPSLNLSINDNQLRADWEQFNLLFAHVAPFHGGVIINMADKREEFLHSLQSPYPTKDFVM